jgi:hypothetical protein
MTKLANISLFPNLVLLLTLAAIAPTSNAFPSRNARNQDSSNSGTSRQASLPLQGTWSGAFFSKHSNNSGFTMTVVINPDSRGHLVGDSSLNSDCLKGAKLQVTATGSNVVLAGSDPEGDSLTVHGTLDSSGSLMQASYILNGSASGKCEIDDGTGNLSKR